MVVEVRRSVVDDQTVDTAHEGFAEPAAGQLSDRPGAAASNEDVPLRVEDLVGAGAGLVLLVEAVQTEGDVSAGPGDGESVGQVVVDLLAERDSHLSPAQVVLYVGPASSQGDHHVVLTSDLSISLLLTFPHQQSALLQSAEGQLKLLVLGVPREDLPVQLEMTLPLEPDTAHQTHGWKEGSL